MQALSNFHKARVLVIGDVMLDRYWWGQVTRISPEAPVPVVNLERSTSKPGGAANVALNAAALGANVKLVSAIGDDAAGDEMAAVLERRGLTTAGLQRVTGRRTSVKTRIIAHNQQVARVDSEQADELPEEHSQNILETIRLALPEIEVVIVSDYAKGTLGGDLLRDVIAAATEAGKQVLVDPKGKDYSKYAKATMLTPNKREAAEACKIEESDPQAVSIAGGRLLEEIDLENVLITEGEHGMTLFSRGAQPFHLDAVVHQVYDVTGAGDSVIACLGVALAAGASVQDACGLANAAGGISVQHVGTHAVTFDELTEVISLARN